MKIGNSSSIDSGSKYDSYGTHFSENSALHDGYSSSASTGFVIGPNGRWNDDTGGLSAVLYLQRGSTTSTNVPYMHGSYVQHNGGTGHMSAGGFYGRFGTFTITDMDRIEFANTYGTILLGRISVYGIKHT
jgi:hypothetical protein